MVCWILCVGRDFVSVPHPVKGYTKRGVATNSEGQGLSLSVLCPGHTSYNKFTQITLYENGSGPLHI